MSDTNCGVGMYRDTPEEIEIERLEKVCNNLRTQLSARTADVERLQAEIARLREDAARLDAVESNLWFVEPNYAGVKVTFWVGKAAHMKRGPTLREAIDTAREK